MAHSRERHSPGGIYEPNVTPIIDVALVLVIILLVATPMALQSGIAVSRAAASGRSGDPTRAARVELSIVDAGHVMVNRVVVERSMLGPSLRAMLHDSPVRDVTVRCADGVPHGTFVSVLDEAKSCGAARIAVIGGTP